MARYVRSPVPAFSIMTRDDDARQPFAHLPKIPPALLQGAR